MKPLKTLIVEDSKNDAALLLRHLSNEGYDVQSEIVQTAADFKAALAERKWDIILSDYTMPHFTGLDALRVLKKSNQDIPIIIISGTIGEDIAVETMLEGANDCLMKDNLTRLVPAIERDMENAARRRAQKQTEESLRRSEENLSNAQRIAHIGSWETDLVNNQIFWSDEVYRIYGVSKDDFEATLESFINFIHPEDRQLVQAAADRAITQNVPYTIEHRIVRPDGEIRFVCEVGEVTFDKSGKPLRFIGTVQDITEQLRVEKALRASEAELRALFAAMTDVILVFDAEGRYQKIAPTDPTYLYKPSAELLGKRIDEVFPEEDVTFFLLHIRRALDEGQMHRVEYSLQIGGTKVWFDGSVSPASENSVIWIARDITERKQAEEGLKKSEKQFRAVFDNTLDAIVIADDSGQYIDANPAACALFGLPKKELTKHKLEDFTLAGQEELGRRAWEIFLKQGLQKGEFKLSLPDGKIIDTEFTATANFLPGMHLSALRDISERKTAEHEQLQLAAIVESSSEAIISKEFDGTITSWNKAAENIFGYTEEEIIGQNISILFPAELLAEEIQIIEKIKRGEPIRNYETIRLRKDGSRFQISLTISPIINNEGEIIAVSKIAHDITERKQTEVALQESEKRYRYLTDAMPQLVWATDPNGSHFYYNHQWYDFTGLTEEESLGFGFTNALHPDDKGRTLKRWERAWRNGEGYQIEYRFFSKPLNKYRWFLGRAMPVRNESGVITQWVGTCTDIEDQKKAEESVRLADLRALAEYDCLLDRISLLSESFGTARDLQTIYNALYTFAIDSSHCDGIFVSLFDQERQLRTPSYARCKDEEFDVSEFPPMPMNDSPQSRAVRTGNTIITDDFQTIIKGQPVFHIGLDKDPSLPQSSLAVPMKIMGRIIGALEIQSTKKAAFKKEHATALRMAANLTANAIENVRLLEQERLKEEQLRQSQKLESVGRLAGGIAHDFNNMLTAINGYSDLTLRKLDSEDPLRRNIEEIKKAGERSALLTHQLLAFSRQQILQPKILDLNENIQDTSKMLQRLIGEDIELQLVLNPKIKRIKADPGQLAQVIMNLTVNARDAMPDGGKVTVQTDDIYLNEEFVKQHYPIQAGNYIVLSVSDNGTGMDKATQQQIFEPFFTTKALGEGAGLGLATVYGIVKQSGGYIWAESEIGQGTTFSIYFPSVVEETKPEETTGVDYTFHSGTETILIVEDELIVRSLTIEILEECGYRVIEAGSGKEALEIYEQSDCRIDLLMTDVVMPGMSGRELAEKLTTLLPHLRVLFTSGYTNDAIIKHGISETKQNFIQKPFTFENLSKKVREIIDHVNL